MTFVRSPRRPKIARRLGNSYVEACLLVALVALLASAGLQAVAGSSARSLQILGCDLQRWLGHQAAERCGHGGAVDPTSTRSSAAVLESGQHGYLELGGLPRVPDVPVPVGEAEEWTRSEVQAPGMELEPPTQLSVTASALERSAAPVHPNHPHVFLVSPEMGLANLPPGELGVACSGLGIACAPGSDGAVVYAIPHNGEYAPINNAQQSIERFLHSEEGRKWRLGEEQYAHATRGLRAALREFAGVVSEYKEDRFTAWGEHCDSMAPLPPWASISPLLALTIPDQRKCNAFHGGSEAALDVAGGLIMIGPTLGGFAAGYASNRNVRTTTHAAVGDGAVAVWDSRGGVVVDLGWNFLKHAAREGYRICLSSSASVRACSYGAVTALSELIPGRRGKAVADAADAALEAAEEAGEAGAEAGTRLATVHAPGGGDGSGPPRGPPDEHPEPEMDPEVFDARDIRFQGTPHPCGLQDGCAQARMLARRFEKDPFPTEEALQSWLRPFLWRERETHRVVQMAAAEPVELFDPMSPAASPLFKREKIDAVLADREGWLVSGQDHRIHDSRGTPLEDRFARPGQTQQVVDELADAQIFAGASDFPISTRLPTGDKEGFGVVRGVMEEIRDLNAVRARDGEVPITNLVVAEADMETVIKVQRMWDEVMGGPDPTVRVVPLVEDVAETANLAAHYDMDLARINDWVIEGRHVPQRDYFVAGSDQPRESGYLASQMAKIVGAGRLWRRWVETITDSPERDNALAAFRARADERVRSPDDPYVTEARARGLGLEDARLDAHTRYVNEEMNRWAAAIRPRLWYGSGASVMRTNIGPGGAAAARRLAVARYRANGGPSGPDPVFERYLAQLREAAGTGPVDDQALVAQAEAWAIRHYTVEQIMVWKLPGVEMQTLQPSLWQMENPAGELEDIMSAMEAAGRHVSPVIVPRHMEHLLLLAGSKFAERAATRRANYALPSYRMAQLIAPLPTVPRKPPSAARLFEGQDLPEGVDLPDGLDNLDGRRDWYLAAHHPAEAEGLQTTGTNSRAVSVEQWDDALNQGISRDLDDVSPEYEEALLDATARAQASLATTQRHIEAVWPAGTVDTRAIPASFAATLSRFSGGQWIPDPAAIQDSRALFVEVLGPELGEAAARDAADRWMKPWIEASLADRGFLIGDIHSPAGEAVARLQARVLHGVPFGETPTPTQARLIEQDLAELQATAEFLREYVGEERFDLLVNHSASADYNARIQALFENEHFYRFVAEGHDIRMRDQFFEVRQLIENVLQHPYIQQTG